MHHKSNLLYILCIPHECVKTVQSFILSYKVRVADNFLEVRSIEFEGIHILLILLAAIKWIYIKILGLAILGILNVELFAHLLISFYSDFPLRMLEALNYCHVALIESVIISICLLRDLLLVPFCFVEIFNWDIIKFFHELPSL